MGANLADCAIQRLDVRVCTIPTDFPEQDGTLSWDKTTVVIVEASAGGRSGIGFSYAGKAAAVMIQRDLAGVVVGRDAMAVPGSWQAMVKAVRNLGRPGLASMAIAAVDAALWDLKACLMQVPLVTLLGAVRDAGITGFLQVGALCSAFGLPLSAHTAPSIHVHPSCAMAPVRHAEYFHDHARIEQMLFEGAPVPVKGILYPDLSRPGLGLELKWPEIEKYAV